MSAGKLQYPPASHCILKRQRDIPQLSVFALNMLAVIPRPGGVGSFPRVVGWVVIIPQHLLRVVGVGQGVALRGDAVSGLGDHRELGPDRSEELGELFAQQRLVLRDDGACGMQGGVMIALS